MTPPELKLKPPLLQDPFLFDWENRPLGVPGTFQPLRLEEPSSLFSKPYWNLGDSFQWNISPYPLPTPTWLKPFTPMWQPLGPKDPFAPDDPLPVLKGPDNPAEAMKLWADIHGYKEDPTEKWVNFLGQLFNNVLSLDVDFQNLPVNRGSKLGRFSEYAPKSERKRDPSIKVSPETIARAHGEIRPIQGLKESWITRVVLDFKPNVWYIDTATGVLPDLEIDGFTAVDPPAMTFDFSKGRKAVQSIQGGDYSYENPQHTGGRLITPFDAVTDAPPGGHNYWMFRFNPLATSGLAYLMEKTSDGDLDPVITAGRGALLLWAYLPVTGLVSPDRYKKFNIPFNTFPRRFGDLIKFLSPMFDSELSENFKQSAPFYNPNTEYMAPYVDEKGNLLPIPKKWRDIVDINEQRTRECRESKRAGQPKCLPLLGRQPLPDDPKEALRLDAFLAQLGLTRAPRKRGSIIDWIFTDIAHDPGRLKGMKANPYATMHLKMRPTVLDTPVGKLKVDSRTDIRVYYSIKSVQNPVTKQWEARIGLRVDIEPMEITGADLDVGAFQFKAMKLKAKKVIFQIPSIPGMSTEDPSQRPPWTFSLEDVVAEGLHVGDPQKGFDVDMVSANIGRLNFVYREDWQETTLGELKADPKKFDLNKCVYDTPDGKEKNSCSIPDEKGVWKPYAPVDYQGANVLPDTTRVVIANGGNWNINILKSTGSGLEIDSGFGKLVASTFDIPEVRLATTLEPREKSGPNGKIFRKDEIRFVSVTIPEIKSNIGLDLKIKDSLTSLKLEGSSSLKDITYFSENQGKHTHTQVNLDLSGVIKSAELKNPVFGSAKFTTQEDPEHVYSITGKLRSTSLKSNEDPKAKPKTEFDLDLDLPYVGFETDGVFKIPHGSSTLRKAHLNLSAKPELAVKLTGHIDLNDASYEGTEPFDVGRFQILPKISNFSSKGDFEFEMSPGGFSLKPAAGSTDPLQLNFDLDGSKFHHTPDLSGKPGGDLPEAKVVETDVALKSAKFRVGGLRQVEVKRVEVDGKKRNKLTQLDAGPITLHHLDGSGSIWIDLAIWGFVRGLFPMIGGGNGGVVKRPDPAPLSEHMAADEKKAFRNLVETSDYIHFGKVQLETLTDKWKFNVSDFLLNLHEVGGRQQFGLIRVPEFNIESGGSAPGVNFPKFNLGKGGFLVNIYLNDPERGGFFRIQRWKKLLLSLAFGLLATIASCAELDYPKLSCCSPSSNIPTPNCGINLSPWIRQKSKTRNSKS